LEVATWASSDGVARLFGIGCGVLRTNVHQNLRGGRDEGQLLQLIATDLDEAMARVVPAGLLLVGKIVEDLFAGQEIRKRSPSAPLASRVGGDLDGGLGLFLLVPLGITQDLGLVEQTHLVGHGPLAARTEALALQQADVLAELADLLAVLGDRLLVLQDFFVALRSLLIKSSDLTLLQKHQRPQILDRVREICGRRCHDGQPTKTILNYKTESKESDP